MANRVELEGRLRNFVVEIVKKKMQKLGMPAESINDDFMLTESGVIDSMGFLELIGSVEKEFGIEIDFSEKDPSEFLSLGGFVKGVLR